MNEQGKVEPPATNAQSHDSRLPPLGATEAAEEDSLRRQIGRCEEIDGGGAAHPVLDGSQGDAELPGDGPHRLAAADGGNQVASALGSSVCLLISASRGVVFPQAYASE